MHSDAGRTIGSVTLLLPQDEVLHDTDEALVAAHTDYAARALSRARHSERGATSPAALFYGVALNLLREHWRKSVR